VPYYKLQVLSPAGIRLNFDEKKNIADMPRYKGARQKFEFIAQCEAKLPFVRLSACDSRKSIQLALAPRKSRSDGNRARRNVAGNDRRAAPSRVVITRV